MPLSSSTLSDSPIGGLSAGASAPPKVATSIAPSALFGTAYATYKQVGLATGIQPTVAFGADLADFLPRYFVLGYSSTQFGTPTASYNQLATGIGFKSTKVGRPQFVRYNYVASALQGARVGTPNARTSNFTAVAQSIAPSTVFGTPSRSSSISCTASSVFSGRVGTPFGTYERHGVAGIDTHTAFGTPRMNLPIADYYANVFTKQPSLVVWTE